MEIYCITYKYVKKCILTKKLININVILLRQMISQLCTIQDYRNLG